MRKVSRKKILFYNWVQFDETNNRGGGVNVYQNNLIKEFVNNKEYEVYFLSSGTRYDLLRKKPYLEKTRNIYGDKCKSFRIVNSRCTAPMGAMIEDIDIFLNDESSYDILKKFIIDLGGFDIIHFNNIEGLSSKCLEIKKDFPGMKVFFTVHNYLLFTPEVNMFYLNKDANHSVVRKKTSRNSAIRFYKVDTKLRRIGLSSASAKTLLLMKKITGRKTIEKTIKIDNEIIEKYRNANVQRANRYIDCLFAVSNCTRKIAIKEGVNKEKIRTVYIGTDVAEKANYRVHKKEKTNTLAIAFMGYFERVKGFDFFINALEKVPEALSRNIDVLCYAKIKNKNDYENVEKIKKLNIKFHSAKHINGYNRSQLSAIMSRIDLGVVPVIWEDNLPQVAIEYAAYGVPVLCSNMGGARELSSSEHFVFKTGNEVDFIKKISDIFYDRRLLDDYFRKMNKLKTIKEHIDELRGYYEK